MRKLRLDVEDLAVESFDPAPERAPTKGTVRGREYTEETCFNTACGTCYTVDYTCEGWTCDNHTCNWAWDCPQTYGVTCPAECRTQGVIC